MIPRGNVVPLDFPFTETSVDDDKLRTVESNLAR
jgi:hypothetical protein